MCLHFFDFGVDVCEGSVVSVGDGVREGDCEGYEPQLDMLGVGVVSEGLLSPAGEDDDDGGGGAGEDEGEEGDGDGAGESEGGDDCDGDGVGEDEEDVVRSPARRVLAATGEVVPPLGWVDELLDELEAWKISFCAPSRKLYRSR